MLFDPRPKSSRRELFDRKRELETLDTHARKCTPLLLVLGIRRIGKTSLLKSFLEEWTGTYIDLRGVNTLAGLYNRVSQGLSGAKWRIHGILRGIRGVTVHSGVITLKWKGSNSIDLLGLLEEMSSRVEDCFIIVFDEAQTMRPPISTAVKNAAAYAYDNLDNIMLVFSGSEIGLLHDFIGTDDLQSPLYGRYYASIVVDRFTPDMSIEFLRRGFEEERFPVTEEIMRAGVDLFDGIVGWLVFYGRSLIDGRQDPDTIYGLAVSLALEELAKLSTREKSVLKAIAHGCQTWSCIRDYVSTRLGLTIPKSSLTRTIRKLEKLSIIKDYSFLDPVYKSAAEELRIRG